MPSLPVKGRPCRAARTSSNPPFRRRRSWAHFGSRLGYLSLAPQFLHPARSTGVSSPQY
jgi:hypothetical protein